MQVMDSRIYNLYHNYKKNEIKYLPHSPFYLFLWTECHFIWDLDSMEGLWTRALSSSQTIVSWCISAREHCSWLNDSHPLHTALKRWTGVQDKHSSKLILEQVIRGGCCRCHQRLAAVHTDFLTYVLSLLSKLCCEWQHSLPGCRRTVCSTTTKPNFSCEDQRSLTNTT